jgi:Zn-dependent peptidase ImmA (M78 family)
MRISEIKDQQTKVEQVRKFADWAIEQLNIETPPAIKYGNDMTQVNNNRSFGSTRSNGDVWVHVGNRNPADIMRTLVHELIHVKQFELGNATDTMDDEQRQNIEDVANALAGRIMRIYGKEHEEIYESAKKLNSIISEALSSHGIKGRRLV